MVRVDRSCVTVVTVPTITATTDLPADVETALALNLDLGVETVAFARHRLRAVSGADLTASGTIGDGERVRWAARLFGVLPVRHTSRIAVVERTPRRARFVDTMVSGVFTAYAHEHTFVALSPSGADPVTRQVDAMSWTSPLGALGRVADVLAVRAVMRHLLGARNTEVRSRLDAAG